MRMLDLFAGRLGWSKAFLARGWKVTAVDLVEPPEIPEGVRFIRDDVLQCSARVIRNIYEPDFICASPPCEEFSVWGMRNFHPRPKYPELGIKLFNHTRAICEAADVPFVIENVRAAQDFVGKAMHHAGPFYLWGTGVPPLLNQGIKKPFRGASGSYMAKCPPGVDRKEWRMRWQKDFEQKAGSRKDCPALAATIPPELANCVAEYAERLIEAKVGV